ncbi:MAG: hypothetical protein HY901_08545, partial [Deltaproteobacteria bacterium]|nr:hypothetical protein [Deltaproteobacteria bacterium]
MDSLALVVLAAALAATPARSAPASLLECGAHSCRYFDTPAKAMSVVLETRPLVLGIGEYHEVEGGPKVKSALKRFTETLLPLLKGKASDLIAETWVTLGHCGKVEKATTQQIERETERPA